MPCFRFRGRVPEMSKQLNVNKLIHGSKTEKRLQIRDKEEKENWTNVDRERGNYDRDYRLEKNAWVANMDINNDVFNRAFNVEETNGISSNSKAWANGHGYQY